MYSRNTSGERQNRFNLPPRYSGNRFQENGLEIADSQLTFHAENNNIANGELSVRGIPHPGAIARQNARSTLTRQAQIKNDTNIKEPIVIDKTGYSDHMPEEHSDEAELEENTTIENTAEEAENALSNESKSNEKTDSISGILSKLTTGSSDELLIILILLLLSGDGKENNDIIIFLALLLALS